MIPAVECIQCNQPARHVATVLYVMPTGIRGLCEFHFCDVCNLLQIPLEDYRRLKASRPDLAPATATTPEAPIVSLN